MADLIEPTALVRSFDLIYATEHDRYFDYCLEPYRPRRPWRGKIRSENLLWHSLQVGAAIDALGEPIKAVQQSVGRDLTVWGVKWDGAELWWELYFYDPRKESPEATLGSIARVLEPWARISPEVSEAIPYMMVSFDLSPRVVASGEIPEVNLYMTGQRSHSGRSYKAGGGRIDLENTYHFMSPKKDIDDVLPLLMSSVFVDYSAPRTLSQVIFPELFACKKICIAKKRTCDAVYFSGVTVDQLLWFLHRFDYPSSLRVFVEKHRQELEHLYFDVGIDYRQDAAGRMIYPKSSYYGSV